MKDTHPLPVASLEGECGHLEEHSPGHGPPGRCVKVRGGFFWRRRGNLSLVTHLSDIPEEGKGWGQVLVLVL